MPDAVQVSDPEPMMGIAAPLPGRADFPGAQPPAESWRTYNEPQPGPGGMKASDLKDAMAAVQAARRFQGGRALSEDLQRGIPLEQALLRNGENIFFNAPQQFANAMLKLRSGMGIDTGPARTVPALDENNQPIKGTHILRSQHGLHVIKDAPDVAAKQAEAGRKFKLTRLGKQLDAATAALAIIPKASPRRATAQSAVDTLQKQVDALISTEAPKVVKWEDFVKQTEGK